MSFTPGGGGELKGVLKVQVINMSAKEYDSSIRYM